MTNRYETGMNVRRRILGDAHVDRAEAAKTPFDTPFQEMITETAWGNLWASDRITDRERSMLTLALLAATGNFEEIPMHIRATARTGASKEDVAEAFQHVAIYAGVPKANHALKLAKQTYAEMEDQGNAHP
ncbi:MAG: 4-carboxymuconolactone decarboxylase [Sagittula sp.]|jgi:4-carboxymuconolactone decarboxylase|uniref:4-carboxymuconolactone decarboxylase n=1 Tax=unclassified Sagittula TaxID=2624628 RepID=UPI000C2D60DE|nr:MULTISPECIES: 4-carboxymuconolactone decarboxylase [unclassified Sagittula]AUC53200.1 4-carboxymuconolactone decarboxylase [Sagittula sp. P11]WHZ35437.1 4-carboxymuconolactone decarboxylase [Sagittula sp. MA-2]